jgi:hypothetical protein
LILAELSNSRLNDRGLANDKIERPLHLRAQERARPDFLARRSRSPWQAHYRWVTNMSVGMLLGRVIAGAIGLLVLFTGLRALFLSHPGRMDLLFVLLFQALIQTIALLALWFAAVGQVATERKMIGRTLLTGLTVGVVALLAGFFGPLIFTPQSNQGSLLGIFITGPAGFVLGCIAAFIWCRVRAAAIGR